MKNIIVLGLSLILLFPYIHAHAFPGDAELVINNLDMFPRYPQEGEPVRFTAEVHNAGITSTNSIASIITAGYFVDDELLQVKEIGNVEPGLKNKIIISSDFIWNAEPGIHKMKIILDYHDTLNDKYDSPDDDALEKSFTISAFDSAKMNLTSSTQHIPSNTDVLVTATIFLTDSNSSLPLSNKKIILNFDDVEIPLTTNRDGIASYSKMVNSAEYVEIQSSFEGDDRYSPTNSSLTIYSIPHEINSAMILNVADIERNDLLNKHSFEFLIFQDSYDNLAHKIILDSANGISDIFLVPLPSGHDYFAEVYLDGRFFFLTDKQYLNEESIIVVENFSPSQSAEIRFKVVNNLGLPQNDVTVDNWIYVVTTSKDGFTEWVEMLPSPSHMPYIAKIILSNGTYFQSEPFVIYPDERKTVELNISQISSSFDPIPDWIQTDIGLWANDQIDDQSFLNAMQFLIDKDILDASIKSDNNTSSFDPIPDWIQTHTSWWANDQIDDQSFLNAMQFLIDKAVLQIN